MASQTNEDAKSAISAQPDAKTRRYDRQLRLWASSGQSALESARVLIIGVTATSTSSLKNLILPGVGSFTILDDLDVTGSDAGNNFFLESGSIGKNKAQEAVRLLGELNESVEGIAVTESIESVIKSRQDWLKSFTLIIAHNIEQVILNQLADICWEEADGPTLIVVRTAGFLAEFFLQYREHTILDPHTEINPSLRIDKPFPELLEQGNSLDLAGMDPTDHAHIPFLVILVRAAEDWKACHNGKLPSTYSEKKEFKKAVLALQRKPGEENFEEAEAQAYRCWTETKVPVDITTLFAQIPANSGAIEKPFYALLRALQTYTSRTGFLPLSPALPDMRASTESYISLQRLYKTRAELEKSEFLAILEEQSGYQAAKNIGSDAIETFLKNSHALRILKGQKYGALDADRKRTEELLKSHPKEMAHHLAISSLRMCESTHTSPNLETLIAEAVKIVGSKAALPEHFNVAAGEIIRAPTADLPNVAAFLGGLVAQEAIKMITKQYVPINGYCVLDLVDTWTGVVGGL